MQKFDNGQKVNVEVRGGDWQNRTYVGQHPTKADRHVYVDDAGDMYSCGDSDIRPVPAEQWIAWTKETRPNLVGSVFRRKDWDEGAFAALYSASNGGVAICSAEGLRMDAMPRFITHEYLFNDGWLVMLAGSKTFDRCGTKVG